MKAKEAERDLRAIASLERKKANEWFFKTGPGQYGEGDEFIGVSAVPLRKIVKKYRSLPIAETRKLLASPIHEIRLCGLLILVDQFEKSKNDETKKIIYQTYLEALDQGAVNNWDLVDLSAHKIVGAWLKDKDRKKIFELAISGKLWHERVAVLACFWFIKDGDYKDSLIVTELLVNHQHDLIHKAVGWMLREIGKRDQPVEEEFLKKHQKTMPRTMLRYAIEKFPEPLRQRYLKGIA